MSYLIDESITTYQYISNILTGIISGDTSSLVSVDNNIFIPDGGGVDCTISGVTEFNNIKIVGKFENASSVEILFNDVSQLIHTGNGSWETINVPVTTWNVEPFKVQVWYQFVQNELIEIEQINAEYNLDNYGTKAYVDAKYAELDARIAAIENI